MKRTRVDIAEDLHKSFPDLSESLTLKPLLNELVSLIKGYLMAGDTVHFSRFGTLEIRIHAPQRFVSNLKGYKVEIPNRRLTKFRMSRYFRDELNEGK
jgi:nucleoid DNA-binding protein